MTFFDIVNKVSIINSILKLELNIFLRIFRRNNY